MSRKPKSTYSSFTTDDFLLDDDFIQWVQHPTPDSDAFWQQFLLAYPAQRNNVMEARLLLQHLQFETSHAPATVFNNVWGRLEKSIALPAPGRVRRLRFPKWAAAACITAALVLAGAWWYAQPVSIRTGYGEMKKITLPDSSIVMLNANSRLRYARQWHSRKIREVWMEGEGYFDVRHLRRNNAQPQPSDQFVVHLQTLHIHVLGTSFNVQERRRQARIVLNSGHIEVDLNDNLSKIALQPGEMLQYAAAEKKLEKKKVTATNYNAWTSRQLVFNTTPLADVIRTIEDTYGYKVVLQDSLLTKRTISGTISISSEQMLFMALETTFNVKITKEDNTIFINNQ